MIKRCRKQQLIPEWLARDHAKGAYYSGSHQAWRFEDDVLRQGTACQAQRFNNVSHLYAVQSIDAYLDITFFGELLTEDVIFTAEPTYADFLMDPAATGAVQATVIAQSLAKNIPGILQEATDFWKKIVLRRLDATVRRLEAHFPGVNVTKLRGFLK